MNSDEKRRLDDDPLLNIFKNWQFYGSAAMALIAVGGMITTIKIMGNSVERATTFQAQQQSINARLATLIETYDHRIQDLEDWRNGVSEIYSNKRHN